MSNSMKSSKQPKTQLSYLNKRRKRVQVRLTSHARRRFAQRWQLLNPKQSLADDLDAQIALCFNRASRVSKKTNKILQRLKRHGQDTLFFRDGNLTFVVVDACLVTVEISQKDKRNLNHFSQERLKSRQKSKSADENNAAKAKNAPNTDPQNRPGPTTRNSPALKLLPSHNTTVLRSFAYCRNIFSGDIIVCSLGTFELDRPVNQLSELSARPHFVETVLQTLKKQCLPGYFWESAYVKRGKDLALLVENRSQQMPESWARRAESNY